MILIYSVYIYLNWPVHILVVKLFRRLTIKHFTCPLPVVMGRTLSAAVFGMILLYKCSAF